MSNQKIKKEKDVLNLMISIYCKKNHHQDNLCPECQALQAYAFERLENCIHHENKDFCSFCLTHCYREQEREQIKKVMRFSGKRLFFYKPVYTSQHIIKMIKFKKNKG